MKALGIAATGMLAQQTNVDVISNNIANANTTGFKSSRAAFQDLIYETMHREGALTSEEGSTRPTGIDVGLGVKTAGTNRLNTQGGLPPPRTSSTWPTTARASSRWPCPTAPAPIPATDRSSFPPRVSW
jgi:flagellar hook-basal body protein